MTSALARIAWVLTFVPAARTLCMLHKLLLNVRSVVVLEFSFTIKKRDVHWAKLPNSECTTHVGGKKVATALKHTFIKPRQLPVFVMLGFKK
jgi:hypothetical protein